MSLQLNKGQTIQVGKIKYQVLKIQEEIDRVDVEKNKLIGEHTEVELHKKGSKSLYPTHVLKLYYEDPIEATLLEIIQEKASKKIERPKQRGVILSYVNGKKIPIKDIKVISK